ncbi:hypothetical protein D3C80_1626300 [compost metagenome]
MGAVGVPAAGVVRVDAGGAEQALAALIQPAAQFQGLFALLQTGAGQQQLADTGGIGAGEQSLTLFGEAGMSQVDAYVDELHGVTYGLGMAA